MICSLPDQHHGASSTAASTLPSIETTLGVVPHLGLPLDSTLQGVGTQKTAAVGHTVDSRDTPGKPLQAQDGKRDKPDTPRPVRLTQRQRRGESWLRRLRLLPDEVFEQVVRRLQYGATAKDVAQWLTTQPDRGGLEHHAYNTLRLYLQCLRERIFHLDHQRKNRKRAIRRMAKAVHQVRAQANNTISIERVLETVAGTADPQRPLPKDDTLNKVEKEVVHLLAATTTREVLLLTYQVNKERLRAPLELEEQLKLPLDSVTRITGKIIEAGKALTGEHLAITARMKVDASIPAKDSDNH
jgi:hypothetical protein